MSDTTRTIDPTRQGGTVVAANPPLLVPEMTYPEALEYYQKFGWRSLPTKGDRARQAVIAEVERLQGQWAPAAATMLASWSEIRELRAEVDRLRAEMAGDRELARRQSIAWADAYREVAAELARYRAGLQRAPTWPADGLLPAVERQDCDDPA